VNLTITVRYETQEITSGICYNAMFLNQKFTVTMFMNKSAVVTFRKQHLDMDVSKFVVFCE